MLLATALCVSELFGRLGRVCASERSVTGIQNRGERASLTVRARQENYATALFFHKQ